MAARARGSKAIAKRLAAVRRNVFEQLEATVRDESNATLALSRDLAPQLTGQMINSATVTVESRASAGLIRAVIAYPEKYALYQHEGTYNPGPVTAAKLGPQRGVGRKFLQRAVDRRREAIIVQCGRAVERGLRQSLR